MNWRKRYREPKPGDKVKALLGFAPHHSIGDILTLVKKHSKYHNSCDGSPMWKATNNGETTVVYEFEFEVLM